MYLSKKSKIILLGAIPATAIVISAGIATPLIIANENKKYDEFNSNVFPLLVSNKERDELIQKEIINFNPEFFSKDFFVKEIANQWKIVKQSNKDNTDERDIKVNSNWYLFNLLNLKTGEQFEKSFEKSNDPEKEIYKDYWQGWWIDKETNWEYRISSINLVGENIAIKYDGRYEGKYYSSKLVESKESWISWNDDLLSQSKHFLQASNKRIKEFFLNGNVVINLNSNLNDFNPSTITSEDLTMIAKNNTISFTKNNDSYNVNSNSTLFNSNWFNKENKNQSVDYKITIENITNNSVLLDDANVPAAPDRTFWTSSQAYPVDQNGRFDKTNSKAFAYLKSIKNELILPELTNEELIELGPNATEEEKEDKQIQKIIFNPLLDPSSSSPSGSYIPNSGYYAILIKADFGDVSTYIIVWQNLSASSQQTIVENAPQINYKVTPGTNPTAQEIKNNPQELLVNSEQIPNGLNYIIKDVLIPEKDNENETFVEVVIEIQSQLISNLKKTYKIKVNSGILGKKENEFNKEISNVLKDQPPGDYSLITPEIAVNGLTLSNLNQTQQELLDLIKNQKYEDFNKKVKLTQKPGTSFIKYIPQNVFYQTGDTNSIFIEYKIVSATDEKIASTNIKTVTAQQNIS